MESLLDIVIEESRDLKMEDILPNMQIGVMGFLALYGFVTLFQQIYGATIGGNLLLNNYFRLLVHPSVCPSVCLSVYHTLVQK